MTALQRRAIFRLYLRSQDKARNVWEFSQRFRPGFMSEYIGGYWCGMYIGIERDGHTHS